MYQSNIDNFEQLLQKQSFENHTALYNKVLSRNEHTYKPQDVIETVYYQMKEIQLADCSTSARSSTKNLNTVKKSHFLAVNKLPVYSEVIKPNPNKFDTQCVSDTQLINLIETAEAVDTHTGMTQEFDTTFAHSEERSTDNLKHVDKGNMSLNVRTSNDTALNEINSQNTEEIVMTINQIDTEKNTVYNSNKEEQTFKKVVDKTNNDIMKEVPYLDSLFVEAASEDTITLIENVPSTPVTDIYQSYNNEDVDMDTKQWTQRSPSPVLKALFHFNKFKNMNVDTVEYTKKSPSLVFNDIMQSNNITVDTGEQRVLSPVLNAINKSYESEDVNVDTGEQRALCPVLNAINKSYESEDNNFDTGEQSASIPVLRDIIQSYDSKNMNVDTGECTQRSLSPVFNMKSKKRITRTPPLVVSLKEFESFENVVIPLIEDNDLETVKHLINSQILGRELCLNINTDDMLIDRNDSPILEFNSDELKINSKELKTNDNEKYNNIVPLKEIKSFEKHSANFRDEILFSSDEENDYNLKETPDLPLTCALETSFYGNSGFSEKTMYVGFQTASNKSIQICTESFEKAQTLLDVNDRIVKEFNLTELVEKCDTITKPEKSKLSPALTSSAKENRHIQPNTLDGIELSKNIVFASIKEESCDKFQKSLIYSLAKKQSEKQKLGGFMTASNKKIKMSNKTLDICQKVFKDIDLNENFETVNLSELKITDPLLVSAYEDQENKIDKKKVIESNNKCAKTPVDKKDDEVMNDKINDELLLQEFENSEMSVKERKANNVMEKDIAFESSSVNNNNSYKIISNTVDNIINIIQNKGVERHEQKNRADGDKFLLKNVSSTRTTSADSNTGIGFKTASQKNINISAQAFTKSKQLFQDIEIEMKTHDVKTKTTDTPLVSNRVFVGFKTANNKNIKISEQALSKSKNIFKDIDKDNYETEIIEDMNLPTSQILFGGFKTASNKNINMSDEALSSSKKIFNDINKENSEIETFKKVNQPPFSNAEFVDFKTAIDKDIKVSKENVDDDNCKIETFRDINEPSTSKAVFMGFKTANNNNIKISDSALSKSKHIFKDIDKKNPEMQGIVDINRPSTRYNKMANNKDIKMCEGDLSKPKNIFKDIYKEISIHTSKYNKDSGFIGFKTASNKHVHVSAQAIEKCRKLFQDDMPINCMPEQTTEVQDKYTNNNFIGVSTAHNKPTNYPEKALATSQTVLSDHESDHKCKTLSCDDVNKNENTIYKGFQTANKTPDLVSPDSLIRSKMILKDIEISDAIPENIPYEFKFVGFQTANSKPVVVSKESLMASKKMLDDFSDNLTDNPGNAFVGFKTANNKNVKVCDKALGKCRKIFDDEEITFNEQNGAGPESKEENKSKVENSKVDFEKTKQHFDDVDVSIKAVRLFSGFQTANNKTVNVTEEALVKSRQAFQNIDMQNDINMKDEYNKVTKRNEVNSPAKCFGFKTCNNKKISVSKDALIKSKQLFAVEPVIENYKTITRNDDKDPSKDALNLDSIINTQVLNNFEETLCTEDFKDPPKENKRSGSPILSCPRAKKRKKFEIPYKTIPKTVIDFNKAVEAIQRPVNIIEFKADYKKNKEYTLKGLADLENEIKQIKNIDPYVLNFNLDNILNFEFEDARNDLTEGKMTTEEIKRLFTEVTDKKLIPEGWLDTQLKLILWKLISYEIKFPNTLGIVCTVKNAIDQLKYRYDIELYNAERPVLRKILEKDVVCTKTMVLCVAGIYVDGVSVSSAANLTNIELLLTDGWYFIKATIDRMLSKLVYDGKIAIGRKLLISGAELMNCEQGVAPWEDTSAVRLKISGNSTAPVPWHSKLGLRPESRTCAPARLSRLRVEGGKARRVRVLVTRVYPMLYVEKLQDGSTVTRSERLEHLHQAKYEAEREALIEKIYEEVEKEISDQHSEESEEMLEPHGKRRCCESGSQIAKLMKMSKDPVEFRAQLTPSQIQLLLEHSAKQQDTYLEAVRSRVRERVTPRHVVTLARGRVVGAEGGNTPTVKGMLTVWKPNDAVLDIFKEGAWIEVMNVVPTAIRNSEIQLSAGRQSMFRPVKCKNDQLLQPYLQSLKRKCYGIKDISENPSMTTDYNEIDTVGIIFSIDPPIRLFESIKSQFQNVYLSDIDKNMICVNFWGGIKKFGYENVLDTGQVIYCGNLQKRAGNTRKTIPQYRATEFSMFTKTPKNEMGREMVEEMNNKIYGLDRRKFCDDCTAVKQNYSIIKCFDGTENVSPYRFNNSDYNLGRNKMYIDTPVGIKTKTKSDEFSLTGLDFESTFRQQNTQELSPNTLARKKKVNEKIAKLKMYGEPPPLSHINIMNKSKNATNSYKSPLVSGSSNVSSDKMPSVTCDNNLQNVATPKKLPKESVRTSVANECLNRSPIISMNRTYAMKSVNPVKLNFSECAVINEDDNNTVDHFAEEFDGSPPLSLD